MVLDNINEYYLNRSMGCAESMLRAAACEYGLKLGESSYKSMGAFAGGLGCEHLCGAVTGGAAAIGAILNKGDNISLKAAQEATAKYLRRMEEYFGSVICAEMKKEWRDKDDNVRCLSIMRKGAEILDEILSASHFFEESMAKIDYYAIISNGFNVE